MDSQKRRLLSLNLLLQLAAADPNPMGVDGLVFGGRVQFLQLDERDTRSVLQDLEDAGHARTVPQALVKEIRFYRITTDGRAFLRENGFPLPE